MGVTSLRRHICPACNSGSRFVFWLNHKKWFFVTLQLCVFSWLLGCEGSGATFHGLQRPACNPGSPHEIKTMWKMWIQLLCACVHYPMGSREFSWPYMGIVTSMRSPDLNARFWLVETIFAALWLVTPQRGHIHYCRPTDWPHLNFPFSRRNRRSRSSLFLVNRRCRRELRRGS